MVFVLDTSGSMAGVKMEQAKKALKYCVNQLGETDRFALISFATAVNKHHDRLTEVNKSELDKARKCIDGLQATGATAIDAALAAALDMRSTNPNRTFTIVVFTAGDPTIGEVNPHKNLIDVAARTTSKSRILSAGA